MKKFTKQAIIVAVLCALCVTTLIFGLACGKPEPEPQEAVLERIEIAKQPNKTEYYVGEKFSRSGMQVKGYYSDGTSKNVMGYTVSVTGELSLTDTEIVITYQEKTATVCITVTEKQIETQIQVDSADTRTYKVEAEDLFFSSDEAGVARETYFEYHSATQGNPNTSGGVSLGNMNNSGLALSLKVNSKVEADCNIVLAMAFNPSLNYDESIEVYWNGEKVTTGWVVVVSDNAQYAWFDWSEYTLKGLKLKEGINELVLKLVGAISPNYDYLKLDVSPVALEKITGIELTTLPSKTEYKEGEVFDSTGMVLSAILQDGSKVPLNDYTVKQTTLSYGDTEVVLSYKNQWTVSVPVTVAHVDVESLILTQEPNLKEYYVGQKFRTTGLKITADCGNDISLDVTDFVVFDHEIVKEGDTKIVATYNGKSVDIPITLLAVENGAHAKIENGNTANYRIEAEDAVWVPGEGDKKNYVVADDADASGGKRLDSCDWMTGASFMVMFNSEVETKAYLTFRFDTPGILFDDITDTTWNGERVTVGDYSTEGWLKFSAHQSNEIVVKKGLNVLVITFKQDSMINYDYFELNVNPMVGLEVSGEYKTDYNEGEKFDVTGMVVNAVYLDGNKSQITDYTVNLTNALTVDDTKIVVSYNGISVEKTISVTRPAALVSISVNADNVKKEYWAGEAFDTTGLVVTAHFDDESSVKITSYTIVEDYVAAGETFVTVKYENCTAKVEGLTGKVHLTIAESEKDYSVEAESLLLSKEGSYYEYHSETSNNPHTSGGASLGGMNNSGVSVTLIVNSEVEKVCNLVLVMSNNGSLNFDDNVETVWNGVAVKTGFIVDRTADAQYVWFDWSQYVIENVTLNKGLNTLVLKTKALSPNYDYFVIEVNPVVSLDVSGEFKTEYNVGETFDKTGLVVKATHLDESVIEVTDYTVNLTDTLTVNDTKLVVSYRGISVEMSITVTNPATLTSISVSGEYKTEYNAGEAFDTTGLVVTAHYDDGTSSKVDAYTIVEDYVGAGETYVTVKYEECSAKIEGLTGKVHLTIDGTKPSYRVEAEDAAFVSGNPTKPLYNVVDDENASGGKRLDSCDWLDGSTFTISVNSTVATKIKVVVSTDGPGSALQTLAKLSWNNKEQSFDVTPTGGWTNFAPYEIVEVDLEEGVNILVWTITGNINYDYFEIQIVE